MRRCCPCACIQSRREITKTCFINYRTLAANFWPLIRSSRLCSRSRAAAIESLPLQLPLRLRMNASLMGCRINSFSPLRMARRVPALIPNFLRNEAGITTRPFEPTTVRASLILTNSSAFSSPFNRPYQQPPTHRGRRPTFDHATDREDSFASYRAPYISLPSGACSENKAQRYEITSRLPRLQ